MKHYLLQNLSSVIHDNIVIITNKRSIIKSYNFFYFIYNGHKTSYDVNLHFDSQNILIKTYIKLFKELESIPKESIESDTNEEKDLLVNLNHNEKLLPSFSTFIRLIYCELVYVVCMCDSYDQARFHNQRRLKKFPEALLLKQFNFKIFSLLSRHF